jgi:hypothetical protein
MRTGRIKKFLEVVYGRPSLPLEVTFDNRYEPLAGAIGFLTTIVVAGHYGNAMWSVLLPLLATLSTFLGALYGGLGGRSLAIASGHSCIT